LTDDQALPKVCQLLRPDAVIHAAAISQPNVCQTQPELSYQVNVVASRLLAEWCAEAEVPLVFTSSEQVFDGLNPPYRETDPVNPVNRYGEQKAEAETAILTCYPRAIVCRLPLLFGVAPTAPSFIQPFIETLQAGKQLNAFTDEIRTPASGFSVAEGILMTLQKTSGLLHLGGIDRISRYDFARLLVKVLGLPETNINPCRQADLPMAAARPPDVSLNSRLAFSLGYTPLGVKLALEQVLQSRSPFMPL
jgi:dTDP-4-dehydrorhamnose reductase